MVLVVAGLAGFTIQHAYQHVEQDEGDRLKVQARVVDENLVHQIQGVASALVDVRNDFFSPGGAPPDHVAVQRRLRALANALPGMRDVFVLDALGSVIASNDESFIGRNFPYRDYFATPRAHPDADLLYVSKPFKTVSGVWAMALTHTLMNEQGEFAGIVSGTLDPDYFDVVLRSVLYATDMRTTLVHGDGTVFLNMPANPGPLGTNLNKPGSFFSRHRESGVKETLLTGKVFATDEHRIVATRTIRDERTKFDWPLVVHVSREWGAMYAPWRRQSTVLALMVATVVIGSALGLSFVQRRRRESEARDELVRAEREENVQKIRLLTDNIPAVIGYIDTEHRYRFGNSNYRTWFGIDPAKMIGRTIAEVTGETTYRQLLPHLEKALGGARCHWEGPLRSRGGERYYLVDYIPDIGPDGRVRGCYGMSTDITARREAELRQAAVEQRLRDITDNLPILIAYIDADEKLCFMNATFTTWFGADLGKSLNRGFLDVVGKERYEHGESFLRRALAGERVEFDIHTRTLDTYRSLQITYIPDRRADGSVAGIYMLSADMTAAREAERQLLALARFDALTSLPNRHHFNEKVPEAIARAARSGDAIALMFLDVDHFKAINDTLGHLGGDEVLKEFAKRLCASVRRTDTVARLAGDEFVILLEGLHDANEPQLVASTILTHLAEPFSIAGRPVAVSASIGVAFHREGAISTEDLLARADSALYRSKMAGRNRFFLVSSGADPMARNVRAAATVDADADAGDEVTPEVHWPTQRVG